MSPAPLSKYRSLPYKPGLCLGKGGNKAAYEVEGDASLVVLRHDCLGDPRAPRFIEDGLDDARSEREYLRQIGRLGFPVAEILDIGTIVMDGITYGAHTMKRYAFGDRDPRNQLFLSVLCQRTLDQAERMLKEFRALQPLHIEDLQFLFEWDGSFVIADPVCVERQQYNGANEGEFIQLIRGARYAMAVRAGEIIHKESQYFWHAVNDWAVANGMAQ